MILASGVRSLGAQDVICCDEHSTVVFHVYCIHACKASSQASILQTFLLPIHPRFMRNAYTCARLAVRYLDERLPAAVISCAPRELHMHVQS
eukprot:1161601-Pelagomonas_calceolata.AAC.17